MHLYQQCRLGAILLCLAVSACRGAAGPGRADQNLETLTILHTNDLHAHLLPDQKGHGGLANIAAYVNKTRASQPNVLLLDAGDMTQGTPVSSIFLGGPIFEAMNSYGYAAATLGNHEFDNGANWIPRYAAIAHFPILSANVLLKGQPITATPTMVVDVHGLKVGLLGLTTDESIGDPNVKILPPEEAVRRYLPELRKKADLVIALSHLGVDRDKELAAHTEGIDVIVGGHSHTPLFRPQRVGRTLIVQAGYYGRWVGRLDLTVDRKTGQIVTWQGKLVEMPVPGLAPDPATLKVVNFWEGKVSRQVDVLIGNQPRPVKVKEAARAIEKIWQETYHTDFAIQNPGGTREGLVAGRILARDIWVMLPFNNTLAVLDLTRPQVAEMIEGARFTQDKPLYTVLTNSYEAGVLAAQFKLPPARIHPLNVSWRQPVIDYIKAHGSLAAQEGALVHQ